MSWGRRAPPVWGAGPPIVSGMAIRVAIAEDSLIVREGLQQLLATEPDVVLVAACADLDSLLRAVEREGPDVVLTDIRMPPTRRTRGYERRPFCAIHTRRPGWSC